MKDFNISNYEYLFLDRDGVINVERPNDYAKSIDEFVFIEGAKEAISIFSNHFKDIFIVTNQRGVGRNVMTIEDLNNVHNHMIDRILESGGHISKIYYNTDLLSTSINRKPNIGMGMRALSDHPQIDLGKSIMIGNSKSDIEFGNKLGMYTVLVGDKYEKENNVYQIVDAYYQNLYTFASTLSN